MSVYISEGFCELLIGNGVSVHPSRYAHLYKGKNHVTTIFKRCALALSNYFVYFVLHDYLYLQNLFTKLAGT